MEIDRISVPARLDTMLEPYKNPISGHIEISPKIARDILIVRLYAFYRSQIDVVPSAGLEVLAKIAGDGDDLVDYTEARGKFIEERRKENVLLQKIENEGNILVVRSHEQED